jgi:hypothetical protein
MYFSIAHTAQTVLQYSVECHSGVLMMRLQLRFSLAAVAVAVMQLVRVAVSMVIILPVGSCTAVVTEQMRMQQLTQGSCMQAHYCTPHTCIPALILHCKKYYHFTSLHYSVPITALGADVAICIRQCYIAWL